MNSGPGKGVGMLRAFFELLTGSFAQLTDSFMCVQSDSMGLRQDQERMTDGMTVTKQFLQEFWTLGALS